MRTKPTGLTCIWLSSQRDFTKVEPLDGYGGALGIEHLQFGAKVERVQEDLAEATIVAAEELGHRSVKLADLGLYDLPDSLKGLPFLQELDASGNRLSNGTWRWHCVGQSCCRRWCHSEEVNSDGNDECRSLFLSPIVVLYHVRLTDELELRLVECEALCEALAL